MTASLALPAPAILAPLRDYAVSKGLDAGTIARLWDQHCERSAKLGYEAGGTPWRRLVDAAVERMNEQAGDVVRLTERAASAAARAEAEKREEVLEQERYDREKVSFDDFADTLLTKPEQAITVPERWMLLAGSPAANESVGDFLSRVLAPDYRAALARQAVKGGLAVPPEPQRVHPCLCGQPAASWVGWQGRRYWAGQCRTCIRREREAAERRGEERTG